MDRRGFLAGACGLIPVATAGCTGLLSSPTGGGAVAESPTAHLEMDAVADPAIADEVTYLIDGEASPNEQTRLMDRIVDGGPTIRRTTPPLPTDTHVSFEDTVYRLSQTVVETTPATTFSVKIDILETDIPPERTVQFADLPAVDCETFAKNDLANGDVIGIGTAFLYTDDEVSRSALVPESQYDAIAWANGNEAEWVVDDSYDTPIHSYEYTAEVVAPAAEYGQRVREQVAFPLEEVTDRQRDIIQTARTDLEDSFDGYIVGPDETASPAFIGLAMQFQPQTQIHRLNQDPPGDLSGQYLVQYDGETLLTVLNVQEGVLTATETATA